MSDLKYKNKFEVNDNTLKEIKDLFVALSVDEKSTISTIKNFWFLNSEILKLKYLL